ncbi:hypothetical protein A1QO_06215 [Vibrio genomosp. F10 str. ZF-129]|uniref:Uncharacterized protein n=1 Tax=Vibrio genomosp. F10 str. ZF-129 TaxID=1187848 RepID=A0A1E5BG32_9VIBR|nr:hypothetical protein [Vibrio genomosp. F10]OEE34976.1 hypothetical protein A1QO_06215 [Vibrio genomosp. F10 str. ZF-129]
MSMKSNTDYRIIHMAVAVPNDTDQETMMDVLTAAMVPLVRTDSISDYYINLDHSNTVTTSPNPVESEVFKQSKLINDLSAVRHVVSTEERGNHLFISEEGDIAFYKKLVDGQYWTFRFTRASYPSIDSRILYKSAEQMMDYFFEQHDGWLILKTQFTLCGLDKRHIDSEYLTKEAETCIKI